MFDKRIAPGKHSNAIAIVVYSVGMTKTCEQILAMYKL